VELAKPGRIGRGFHGRTLLGFARSNGRANYFSMGCCMCAMSQLRPIALSLAMSVDGPLSDIAPPRGE
jgi:hypothetical protein